MKDLRTILLTGLVAKLKTETALDVFTRIQKQEGITYPYIFIGDVYDTETGPKTSYMYEYDVQVMAVYKDLSDLAPLYSTLDKIKGIINNRTPFEITAPHKILSCELGTCNTMDEYTETGVEHIGVVRMIFTIV